MKVKICGITRDEDIEACEESGADLMGFINIERSKRFVDLNTICRLTSSLQDKSRAVLVLETENVVDAQKAVEATGIGFVQFHSLSVPELKIFRENNPYVKVIKAVGIPKKMDEAKMDEIKGYAEVCDHLLFDSEIQGKSGGTGKQISLKEAVNAAKIARKYNSNLKLFLAGGMDSQRIKSEGKTLKKVFDYVDVNSGVEDQPGLKDECKIKELMDTMRRCESDILDYQGKIR